MKKQFLKAFVIALILVTSVFVLTGCESKKEIVLKDDKTGYTTIFKYPENQDFVVTDEDKDSGKFVEMTVENKSNNIELEMYYFEELRTTYDSGKEYNKEDEGFKEYKWGKYDGFIYSVSENSLYFNILLQEENGDVIGLFGAVSTIDYNNTNITESFNSKDFQDFMNSIEFKIEK